MRLKQGWARGRCVVASVAYRALWAIAAASRLLAAAMVGVIPHGVEDGSLRQGTSV
jgi:hypothetical protein